MNIYAIRDRLLDYFQQPFAAPEDKAVLAAISRTISTGGDDVISQAPQHFEIWRLGKVEETGHITGRPEFLADCNVLIRPAPAAGRESAFRRAQQAAEAAQRGGEQTGGTTGDPRAKNGAVSDDPPPQHQPPQAAD